MRHYLAELSSEKRALNYRKEIDGLRAVAVVPVMLFHAGLQQFSGGFVGVDVFFVVSGYLITSIILSELTTNSFSLRNFYERRARRILPALFFVMLVCIPFAWLLLLPDDMKDFSQSLVAVSLFVSNHLFLSESGYFDTAAELKPLLHTWSLAVEEQYYVIFPIFMIVMWRHGRRWIGTVLVATAIVSLSVAQWGAHNRPAAAFFLLPSRGWELAVGALVAVYSSNRLAVPAANVTTQAASLFGLSLILFSVFVYGNSTPFPGFYALVPTVGTALIILFAAPETLVGRILSTKLLVGIGVISYSAYLWHQPLFAFARHFGQQNLSAASNIGLVLVVLIIAWFSSTFVEAPFRKRGTFGRRAIVLFSLSGSVALGAIGLFGSFDGFQYRFDSATKLFPGYIPDNKKLQQDSWSLLRDYRSDQTIGVDSNQAELTNWYGSNSRTKKVLIVGNSHSKDLFNMFWLNRDLFDQFEFARFGVQIACLDDRRLHAIYSSPNYRLADVIIVSNRWELGARACNGVTRNDFDGLSRLMIVALQDAKKLVIASNTLEFSTVGTHTIADSIILAAARSPENVSDARNRIQLFQKINRAYYEKQSSSNDVDMINRRLRSIASANRLVYLDKSEYLCNNVANSCGGVNAQFEKSFFDYGHYTLTGAAAFGKRAYEIRWLRPIE